MPKQTIRVILPQSDEWVSALEEKYVDQRHYDRLICKVPTDVLKPDGSPLLMYRPGPLPLDVCQHALPALRKAAIYSEHRQLHSGIVGYYDPCRLTTFTSKELAKWATIIPFIKEANAAFRQQYRSRYSVQRKVAWKTARNLVIADTAFTTMTVNRWSAKHDARTRVHKDAGDLPEGFGVISVIRTGEFTGGELIFPKYKVAVDLQTTDLLFCDVHEFHGNGPVVGQPRWERISCIMYYLTSMQDCLSPNRPSQNGSMG